VKKALDMMPEGAGVSVVTRAGGAVLSPTVERIVMLMYADDAVPTLPPQIPNSWAN
jgi:hypothetical protein